MATKVITEFPKNLEEYKQKILSSRKAVSVLGYGNQGRSQALNLRDSGFNVVVGNIKDDYYSAAQKDGFKVYDIARASEIGDILLILVPDEVQPEVFKREIKPHLDQGTKTLVFASGYNYYFEYVVPDKKTVNVLMIAPRMIGWGVRDLFLKKRGFPVLVAVGNDPSGDSYKMLMALAEGMGAFLPGGCAVESSFKEETLLDLLSEQSWAGAVLFMFRAYYEVATELGCSPEAAILEMYASGELAEIGESMKELGLFKQLKTHSHTSQYGQLTRGTKYIGAEVKRLLKKTALEILDGTFAREWTKEQERGMFEYKKLNEVNLDHPMEEEEEKLYNLLTSFRRGVPKSRKG
jgi:ketol-acid reductoisomerase